MDIWFPAIIITSLLLGWLIGRLSNSTSKPSSTHDFNNCSESYIQGLNYLLANKSDKAIELFVDLIKVDSETMETHLALGNLFRSKGEVEHAIKIHQNLVARPNLDQNQRIMALSELAEDYLKAGLLDRAENLFKELVQINPKNAYAQRKLYELYSLEKSWAQARDAAQVLADLDEEDGRLILTHCYCEMAEAAMGMGNMREASSYLDRALQIDSHCIRALLLSIEIHIHSNHLNKARKLFKQLLDTSPQFIELYIKPARELYLQHGSAENYQKFLIEQYEKTHSAAVALELLKRYLNVDDHQTLKLFLRQALEQSPSLALIDFAFQYLKSRPEGLNDIWASLSLHFHEIKFKKTNYQCHVCGYESQNMNWNCPSCHAWSSFKPIN